MSSQPKSHLSPQEYLAGERLAEQKHEYFGGEAFAMAGASFAHVSIASNVNGLLHSQLQGKPCRPFAADLRVKVSRTGLYTYPDVGVLCDEPQFDDEHKDTLLNPRVLIEILSPSTESYDRGKKFVHYRTLESLAEYLLVAQDQSRVEQYTRQPSGDWLLHEATDPADSITLTSIDCNLPLAQIYNRVEFDETE